VALYQANRSDFPTNTLVTTTKLIDVVVYDSNHADDTGLLMGLGKTAQHKENASPDAANHPLHRQADVSFITGPLPIRHSLDASHMATEAYMLGLSHKGSTTMLKLIKQ
tara:strand:- start:2652 stop:2978 length:327 start_codon:yes stop_codon:yes gene_type:complete